MRLGEQVDADFSRARRTTDRTALIGRRGRCSWNREDNGVNDSKGNGAAIEYVESPVTWPNETNRAEQEMGERHSPPKQRT
jgi:hypothetical protein